MYDITLRGIMVFNATFNNIWVVSWWSVLLVEETQVPRENNRPTTSKWQTLSHLRYIKYTSPWAGFKPRCIFITTPFRLNRRSCLLSESGNATFRSYVQTTCVSNWLIWKQKVCKTFLSSSRNISIGVNLIVSLIFWTLKWFMYDTLTSPFTVLQISSRR
jgi:hypothetical protein